MEKNAQVFGDKEEDFECFVGYDLPFDYLLGLGVRPFKRLVGLECRL